MSNRLPEGVKYGFRLAADVTRRDVEDWMAQLSDAQDEVRAELARMRAIKSTVGDEQRSWRVAEPAPTKRRRTLTPAGRGRELSIGRRV